MKSFIRFFLTWITNLYSFCIDVSDLLNSSPFARPLRLTPIAAGFEEFFSKQNICKHLFMNENIHTDTVTPFKIYVYTPWTICFLKKQFIDKLFIVCYWNSEKSLCLFYFVTKCSKDELTMKIFCFLQRTSSFYFYYADASSLILTVELAN